MALIVLTDFCCWVPISVMGILALTDTVTIPNSVYAWSAVFILPVNSAVNPYLYTISHIKRSTSSGRPVPPEPGPEAKSPQDAVQRKKFRKNPCKSDALKGTEEADSMQISVDDDDDDDDDEDDDDVNDDDYDELKIMMLTMILKMTRMKTGGVRRQMPTGLPLDIPILPRKFRNHGYSTYMVGKWHLGYCKSAYTPNERGFDKFYGYYLASEDYYTHMAGNWLDLHDNFDPVWGENGTYSTYLFSNKAVEFIDHHDKSKPFFMYLAYQSIHEPFQVPEKYFDMYPSVKNEMRRRLMA
ncbi:uncharacterized protein [Ptychodera flava]|uniref:uncharacterized protein n=1 Tax=Ptychodera flava TaxID=63121 RepID=UPI00396A10C4